MLKRRDMSIEVRVVDYRAEKRMIFPPSKGAQYVFVLTTDMSKTSMCRLATSAGTTTEPPAWST